MFNKTIEIEKVKIGDGYKPYIVAEMSANHGQKFEIAEEIIKKAKECGANAIKLQTYTPDTLTLNCKKPAFRAKGAWDGVYLYDLYKEAYTPWEWFPNLLETAKENNITLFSTPFDYSALEFLEKYNMPAYKIASPEISDLPLIKEIAKTKKPIILSTGDASLSQISDALEAIHNEGVKNVAILKCTSEYPAPVDDIHLKTIPLLKEMFKCPIGFSDHTLGTSIPISAIALGANIIEKHFILNRNYKTADSFFSATPEELKYIVEEGLKVYKALGESRLDLKPKRIHRSLIAIENIKKGEILREGKNFRSIRPGGGIEPKYRDIVEGRKATYDIEKGTLLTWNLIGGLDQK